MDMYLGILEKPVNRNGELLLEFVDRDRVFTLAGERIRRTDRQR